MDWLRRIRNAIILGLAWAVVWAPIGVLIGLIVDPNDSMDEMWVAVGAYPGLLCGVIASLAGMGLSRRGRLDAQPVLRAAVLGAASGLIVGVFPFVAGTPSATAPTWLGAVVIGSIMLLSTLSAIVTVLLQRYASRRAAS